jgi:hypothetical protein
MEIYNEQIRDLLATCTEMTLSNWPSDLQDSVHLSEIERNPRQDSTGGFLAQYTDPWTSTLSNPKAPADSEIKKLEVKQHPVLGTIVPGRGHFKWQNTQTMD